MLKFANYVSFIFDRDFLHNYIDDKDLQRKIYLDAVFWTDCVRKVTKDFEKLIKQEIVIVLKDNNLLKDFKLNFDFEESLKKYVPLMVDKKTGTITQVYHQNICNNLKMACLKNINYVISHKITAMAGLKYKKIKPRLNLLAQINETALNLYKQLLNESLKHYTPPKNKSDDDLLYNDWNKFLKQRYNFINSMLMEQEELIYFPTDFGFESNGIGVRRRLMLSKPLNGRHTWAACYMQYIDDNNVRLHVSLWDRNRNVVENYRLETGDIYKKIFKKDFKYAHEDDIATNNSIIITEFSFYLENFVKKTIDLFVGENDYLIVFVVSSCSRSLLWGLQRNERVRLFSIPEICNNNYNVCLSCSFLTREVYRTPENICECCEKQVKVKKCGYLRDVINSIDFIPSV